MIVFSATRNFSINESLEKERIFEAVKKPWNFGTKGVCKPNSRSFVNGREPWNKGKKGLQVAWNKGIRTISNIELVEITKPILSPLDPQKVAIGRLEEQRLARVEAYKIEVANRPKEITHNNRYKICITEGKFIDCKKQKSFCSYWEFCHKNLKESKLKPSIETEKVPIIEKHVDEI